MIFRLLIQIREHIGVFYKLCEDIAHLDMLQSLARASSAIHYVRPKFSDYLEIEHARHPLLDYLCSTEPIANYVFASKYHNMNIITGPNGSGKSIFIRQIVLIQVMAQVGCYVPAHSATLRVSDYILAKVYLEDNMDCGASAFVLEMKEIQYFLNVLTDNSLIVIDELCRSTSVEEGTALAMAVCEKLMKTSAFLFFTTHFKFMTKLENLHYNVKTWQLETLTEIINDQMILRFTYNVIPGVTALEHYGIFLAKTSWPEIIIKYAEEILEKLSKTQKKLSSHLNKTNEAARLKYNLEAEFKILKTKNQLTQALMNERLAEYQKNLENLGYRADQLHITTQENNCATESNPIEVNDDIQMEDLSQMLNSQTNIVKQTNDFRGFDFHSNENPQFLENFNNPVNDKNQEISFNNSSVNTNVISHGLPDYFNLNNISHNSLNISNNFQDFNVSQNICLNNQNLNPTREYYNQSICDFGNNLGETEIIRSTYQPNSKTNKAPSYFENFNPNTNTATFKTFPNNKFSFHNTTNHNKKAQEDLFPISQDSNISKGHKGTNITYDLDFNILEPEIILRTPTNQLEINFTHIQKDTMTVHQITRQNSITALDTSAVYSNLSHDIPNVSKMNVIDSHTDMQHLGTLKEQPTLIKGKSFVSEEDSFFSTKCHEDEVSVFSECSYDINNMNKGNIDTESVLSVNEQQFSLPLQQNIERTSTPLPIDPQPISFIQEQNVSFNKNSDLSDNRSKSSNSNTVKWGLKKTQNVLSSPTFTISNTSEQANLKSTKSTTNKSVATNSNSSANHMQISKLNQHRSQSNSDSIKWNTEKILNEQQAKTIAINSCADKIQKENSVLSKINESLNLGAAECTTSKLNSQAIKSKLEMQKQTTSTDSSNEQQFSLPLQQNLQKTPKMYSQPMLTSKTLKQSKSTSTNSDSIKWQMGKTKNILKTSTPSSNVETNKKINLSLVTSESTKWTAMAKMHKSIIFDQTDQHMQNLLEINENEAENVEKVKKLTDKQKNVKADYHYSKSNMEFESKKQVIVPLKSNNISACSTNNTENSITNFHYCSNADISEIIDDLESCSEYFTNEENWDTLDEETNLKLRQINNKPKQTDEKDKCENQKACKAKVHKNQMSSEREISSESKNKDDFKITGDSKRQVLTENVPLDNTYNISSLNRDIGKNQNEMNFETVGNQAPSQTRDEIINNKRTSDDRNVSQIISTEEILQLFESDDDFGEIEIDKFTNKERNKQENKNQKSNYLNSTKALDNQRQYTSESQISKKEENFVEKGKTNIQHDIYNKADSTHHQTIDTAQSIGGLKSLDDVHLEENPSRLILNDSFADLFNDESIVGSSQHATPINLSKEKVFIEQKEIPKSNPSASINYSQQKSTLSEDKNDNITSLLQPKKRKLDDIKCSTPSKQNLLDSDDEIQPSNLFQVSPNSSDFELPEEKAQTSTALKKKTKRILPKRSNDSNRTKSTNQQKIQTKKNQKRPKFTPPQKLTKKKIEQEFYEQDRKMLESGDSSQYIERLLNRPSVKQLQATKHIMSIHKTSSGVVVVPIKENKRQTRKRKFITPLKCQPSDCDVTLLSDKNSVKYEEFMNKKKEEVINVRQDVIYQYNQSKIVRKNSNNLETVSTSTKSSEECIETITNAIQNFKTKLLNKIEMPYGINNNEPSEQSKGYYTQNKGHIDNIINKYLNPEMKLTNPTFNEEGSSQKSNNSSIFSKGTEIIVIKSQV